MDNFMECAACASKSGMPVLCDSCLHNRRVIEQQQAEIDEILNDISDMECSCLPYAEQTGEGVCPRCRLIAKHRGG